MNHLFRGTQAYDFFGNFQIPRRCRPLKRHFYFANGDNFASVYAEMTTVRDNLRHASIAATYIYLQSDEIKRARQMDQAFAAP
ncbi:hypothetical protein G3O00_40095 [Burkholderia sp. Ac-20384]|nr:hypothetical protein [Burkholderia sp. Ac-20384]